jgi:hypothetical protein
MQTKSRPSHAKQEREKMKTKTIKLEVSEEVLIACMHVCQWCRGSESKDEVGALEVIEYDFPVLEDWLEKLGVLPRRVYTDDHHTITNSTAGSTAQLF